MDDELLMKLTYINQSLGKNELINLSYENVRLSQLLYYLFNHFAIDTLSLFQNLPYFYINKLIRLKKQCLKVQCAQVQSVLTKLYIYIYQMKKGEDKYKKYLNKEGQLEKQSQSIFLGFQKKFWKILNDGTKIGYRNLNETEFNDKNIFLIKSCTAAQGTGQNIFQLATGERTFVLRAPDQMEKNQWIKALTCLRKELFKTKKKKAEPSPTETTLATQAQKQVSSSPKKTKRSGTSTSIKVQSLHKGFTPSDLGVEQKDQLFINQLLKYMSQKFLKYHTLLVHLKTKKQGVLISSIRDDTYLLISPKSLYPQVHISDQNLTNKSLPPWLEINKFYKVSGGKQKKKQIFDIRKIQSIDRNESTSSFRVNIGEIIYQFFTDTTIQMQCVCSCLQNAIVNAEEVMVRGEIKKKNYDRMIDAHETEIQVFKKQANLILEEFIPDFRIYKHDPDVLVEFMENVILFLREFIEILEKKKKDKNHVILDMLIIFHEEVKVQVKLTWDSSCLKIQQIQILKILRCLSQYHKVVEPFIKSVQFLEGMKQLSKIFVRASWKNFENIIQSIVEQQKKINYVEDKQQTYLETNGVIDLFKFIYEVTDLAEPHWKNKIHLHNVNRLMQKALNTFINEIRSAIDEEVIPDKQIVALANNYFRFKENVNEFYSQKFEPQLAQKTKDAYQKIINNYKDVSMIILDKLCSNLSFQMDSYFEGNNLLTIKPEVVIKILCLYHQNYQKMVHMAFISKLHSKFVSITHLKILDLLCFDIKRKKRPTLKELLKNLQILKERLIEVFQEISKMHIPFRKKMQETEKILSYDLYADIETIISSTVQPLRSKYLQIMELREDFYAGSALYKIVNEIQYQPSRNKTTSKHRKYSQDIRGEIREKSLTRQYIDEYNDDKSQKSSFSKSQNNSDKLISQGYLIKGKRNQKVWEKQFFRLKNGFLYIFQNENSDRCQNSIDLKNMIKIENTNPEKPSFILIYRNLGKQKQIKLKSDTVEIKQKWINSLQLQKRRLQNQKQIKKKAVKLKQTGRKKNQLIIDYEEIEKGKDYFSYSN